MFSRIRQAFLFYYNCFILLQTFWLTGICMVMRRKFITIIIYLIFLKYLSTSGQPSLHTSSKLFLARFGHFLLSFDYWSFISQGKNRTFKYFPLIWDFYHLSSIICILKALCTISPLYLIKQCMLLNQSQPSCCRTWCNFTEMQIQLSRNLCSTSGSTTYSSMSLLK